MVEARETEDKLKINEVVSQDVNRKPPTAVSVKKICDADLTQVYTIAEMAELTGFNRDSISRTMRDYLPQYYRSSGGRTRSKSFIGHPTALKKLSEALSK